MRFTGQCDRCKQPYEKKLEDAARVNTYVDCTCGALVALVREDKQPPAEETKPKNPMVCGEGHGALRFSPRHRHFICPTCEAKG